MAKSPQSPPSSRRMIEMLAFPLVQILDVTGPLQVFATANDQVAKSGGVPPYALRVVAQNGQSVRASAGLGITTVSLPVVTSDLDTLLIAGGPGIEAAAADPVLVD